MNAHIRTHVNTNMRASFYFLLWPGIRGGGRGVGVLNSAHQTKQQNKQRKTTHRQGSRATHKQTFNTQSEQNGGGRLGTRKDFRRKTKNRTTQNKTDPPITPGGGSGPFRRKQEKQQNRLTFLILFLL